MLESVKPSSILKETMPESGGNGKSGADLKHRLIPMDNPEKRPDLSSDSQVWNAIAAFERILEAMPHDRVALETLYEAYEQIGQKPRAIEYLVRLCESVIEVRDSTTAPSLIDKLGRLDSDDPAVSDLIARLETLAAERADAGKNPAVAAAESKRKNIDITGELSLAWNLFQAGQLNQDQYSAVVHDLSESSSANAGNPVTVLHVLQGRAFPALEKVVAFLAKDSGTPVVTLSNFEIQRSAYSMLTLEFMETRGAIAFEQMGSKDALVAVLNPYDTGLREEVRHITQRKCHFYQVTAEDYDRALGDIRKSMLNPVDD